MIQDHPKAIEASAALINDLGDVVQHLDFDDMTRLLYSTDASIYQMMPVGVVFPKHSDEISATLEVTKKHGVPVLPRGGGSSLCGNAIGHALIIDHSRYMDQIIEIDPEKRIVRTQPGITLGKLNKVLARYQLMYGPDPASGDRATMGGILANNATGSHSIVYGMSHDHVLSTDVVLSDGSQVRFNSGTWGKNKLLNSLEGDIYRSISRILVGYADEIKTQFPKTFRQVAGYNLQVLSAQPEPNLASLIVGSEGTLAVITEASLNLVPIPKKKRLAIVHFSNLRASMESVAMILETNPSTVEVLDKMLMDLTRGKTEFRHLLNFIQGDPEIILLVEYTAESETLLDHRIQQLANLLVRNHHHDPLVVVSDPLEQEKVWNVRKLGLGILMSIRGDAKPIPSIEDAAVPVQHLADYITDIFEFAHGIGIEQVAMYGHASAGCLHIRPVIDLKSSTGIRRLRQVAEKSRDLVIMYAGTTSGEHGEGISRGEFSHTLFGSRLVEAFRLVKSSFDPQNLLNPGKMFDAPPMDDESIFRYGHQYHLPYQPQKTGFQFIKDGGFASAVEMCNGAGVCRKLDSGVMCPSFQATRDEKHSTRGRANALRAAMMGKLGIEALASRELYQVLDLCLSCHACKTECPSAVDMAKLKAEFTYQYYKEHGIPLRAWLFANIAGLYNLAQPFSFLFNGLMDGPGKWVQSWLGIHPERQFPHLASQTFTTWYRSQQEPEQKSNLKKQVVFFHDTFMEHNEPQIGKAAVKVLAGAGFKTIILEHKKDSGRPAVSKGLLDTASKLAKHNIKLLAPYAKKGIPIVGCEPSVMAMLVDEYPDLVPGEETNLIQANVLMIEDFIVKAIKSGDVDFLFDNQRRHVIYHGHCQQKSVFGIDNTLKMMRMIPNCTVEVIESGCCGMAGSFGYEQEHYDLSIQLAEMSLAPAIRAAAPGTIICASGTSCREQIRHTTGKNALHPIELFAAALK